MMRNTLVSGVLSAAVIALAATAPALATSTLPEAEAGSPAATLPSLPTKPLGIALDQACDPATGAVCGFGDAAGLALPAGGTPAIKDAATEAEG